MNPSRLAWIIVRPVTYTEISNGQDARNRCPVIPRYATRKWSSKDRKALGTQKFISRNEAITGQTLAPNAPVQNQMAGHSIY